MHSKLTIIANMSKINKYGVPDREEFYAYCDYTKQKLSGKTF